MTTAPRIGALRDIDVYSRPGRAAGSAPAGLPFQMRRHALQTPAPTAPLFGLPWSGTDESQTPVGRLSAAYEHVRTPKSAWLADALRALAEVDDETAEDGLPEINTSATMEAERIIVALARHPWAPTVYPTQDAEIAIHFKSPHLPNSVVILLDNQGQGQCYAYSGGHSRRAHYDVSSDLPDGFVREQLRALTPELKVVPETPGGLGPTAMAYFGGFPTVL